MIIKNKQKSFTLIELLVVIVIIGILAGVIMISTSSSIDKANFAKAQAFSSTVQNELLLNLVSEWTFDNISDLGEDAWGNNDGTLHNFANPATSTSGLANASDCVFGACLKFDGVDDYIGYTNTNNLKPNYITISAWFNVKGNANLYRKIFSNGEDWNDGHGTYLRITSAEKMQFAAFTSSLNAGRHAVSTNNVEYNIWQYMVGTWNGSLSKLWIDGNLIANNTSGSGSGVLYNDALNARVGSCAENSQFFNGLIDDVRIYDVALSSAQIKQNYIAGLDSLLSKGSISKEAYNERINTLAYDN